MKRQRLWIVEWYSERERAWIPYADEVNYTRKQARMALQWQHSSWRHRVGCWVRVEHRSK